MLDVHITLLNKEEVSDLLCNEIIKEFAMTLGQLNGKGREVGRRGRKRGTGRGIGRRGRQRVET